MAEMARLSSKEIEDITGITGDHPVAKRNRLIKMGIKAEVNARREVVCFWSWVDAAALPASGMVGYARPANDEDEDIGMNLEALGG